MSSFDEALAAAHSLNLQDRLLLAKVIWEEIPPADWPHPDQAWIAEAQRRSAEYDAGRMKASTWPEVQARARRRAGLDG